MTLKRYRGNECQSFAPDGLWCRAQDVAELELQLEAALIVVREQRGLPVEPPTIITAPCTSCGKQTVYMCVWDRTRLCGEIACREKHEQEGKCTGVRSVVTASYNSPEDTK